MKSHRILIRREKTGLGKELDARLLRFCIRAALAAEGVDTPCEVGVLLTDDEGIRKLNHKFRGKDAPTDVLSFPLQALTPGAFSPDPLEIDPETGRLPLGDIVLSVSRIKDQAEQYGHDVNREMAYLAVHSALHLLGYDHTDEGADKRLMRAREKEIMKRAGLSDE
jgi:probable rRNA maturation factor